MKSKIFDVVTIGSGLGGLTAATLLARKGYKTLLVERKERLGGRFSTVEKDGFKLPTGAISIPDSWAIKLFKEIGIDMNYLHPLFRVFYRIEGTNYEISPEMGIPMVLDIIDKLEQKASTIKEHKSKPVNLKNILNGYLRGMRSVEQEEIYTVRDWLLQYTENERVHEVFDNLCAALMMAHSWELPISKFFKFKEMTKFFIAANGNSSIADALARIVEENGEVWRDCLVTKIPIKDGKATGILAEREGKTIEIQSKVIISDIGPHNTVKLAGKENFDEKYLKQLRIKLRPSPAFLVLFASNKPLCLEGINDGLQIMMGGRRMRTIIPMSNICPELAPPNQHLYYTSVEPISCVHPVDVKCERYQVERDLEELFPDFKEVGRILQIKLCSGEGNQPEGWTWLGFGLPIETPISNLFNVGDACIAPGLIGTTGSVESGYRAAETIGTFLEK